VPLKNLYQLLALTFVFSSSRAEALVLVQNISAQVLVEYDTNPTLVSNNEQAIWRYAIFPKYSIAKVEDNDRWFANGGVLLIRTSNKSISSDRQDPNLALGWEHEYDRGRYNLTFNYARASSRLNEFTTSGTVDRDGNVTSKSISAGFSRLLTDRLDWILAGQYVKADYTGSGFSNSTTKSINSTLTYQLDEKISPFIQFGYSNLNSANAKSSSSQNILAGANFEVIPKLTMSASLGLNRQQNIGNGWIANSTATYTEDKYKVDVGLSRNVAPSGLGQFQKTDNFSLKYTYALSDKSGTGLNFSLTNNSSAVGNETRQLGGWYVQQMSELWQLKLSLDLKALKNSSQSSNASVVGITFIYNTPDF
jgi:hypothetical protein